MRLRSSAARSSLLSTSSTTCTHARGQFSARAAASLTVKLYNRYNLNSAGNIAPGGYLHPLMKVHPGPVPVLET